MKATKLLCSIIFAIFITTIGQGQTNKCNNPTNLTHDQTITREEFLKIKEKDKQRITYMNLTGECKYQLWEAKFKELQQLEFSPKEKEHITIIQTFMDKNKEGLFVNSDEKILKEFAKFSDDWMQEGMEKFGWSYELVERMIADLDYLSPKEFKKLRK